MTRTRKERATASIPSLEGILRGMNEEDVEGERRMRRGEKEKQTERKKTTKGSRTRQCAV
jgi:hypothetical protein